MLGKTFGASRISLSVQRRVDVLDEEHFINQVKIACTFLYNFRKMVNRFLFVQTTFCDEMFSDGRIIILTDALMKVSGSVPM